MINRRLDMLRFKVELTGILPLIWREILVPARYSFWDLHVAIQDVMGWQDYHLHQFRVLNRERGELVLVGIPNSEGFEDVREVLPGWEVAVVKYLSEPGDRVEYEYDFGDSWIHEITLVGVEPMVKQRRYPQCIGGERACPPEDCGGVPGYASLVEAILDPEHPEYDAMNEWLPAGWGPELFKPEQVRFDNPTRRWRFAFADER